MGWQDRDYAAGPSHRPTWSAGPVRGLGGRSIVTTLIIINVAVFVLCNITSSRGQVDGSPVFQWGAMYTPLVLKGQIWRTITADYLHWDFRHILMNMIGLHFLGRPLERDWGPRKFLAVYTIAGLLGSVFYIVLCKAGWLHMESIAAGASGCVLGLLGACAVRYPQAQLLIFFMFPIKIRTGALLFGGWYALNVYTGGKNSGGDACHLAGMVFGAWWVWKGDAWWTRTEWRLPLVGRSMHRKRPGGFQAKIAQRRDDEETIDRILKKVYDGGIHTLSEKEKRSLQDATERQRARERDAGRIDRL